MDAIQDLQAFDIKVTNETEEACEFSFDGGSIKSRNVVFWRRINWNFHIQVLSRKRPSEVRISKCFLKFFQLLQEV